LDFGEDARAALHGTEQKIAECFRGGGIMNIDALSAATGLPSSDVSATLMLLELKKVVVKRADGTFEARPTN
jgi:DNA processing protein